MEGNIVESLMSGLVGALVGSLAAMWFQRKESVRSATLSILGLVHEKASKARSAPAAAMHDEILTYYRTQGGKLGNDASAYLDYLDSLEYLLYCIDRKLIDGSIAREWLRGQLEPDSDVLGFIGALRGLTNSDATFEYLKAHYTELDRQSRLKGNL